MNLPFLQRMYAICTFDRAISGTIRFKQPDKTSPVDVSFDLRGFQPYGIHAIHIHEYGDLSEGCKSLGAHFNPTGQAHGQHAGDLFYNLQADERGEFRYRFVTPTFSLFRCCETCVLGRSVVIHAFRDDLGTKGWTNPESGEWVSYRSMTTDELQALVQKLYSVKMLSRKSLLQKLENESVTTGNASVRMACAVIGLAKK